eukprot:g73812.t1
MSTDELGMPYPASSGDMSTDEFAIPYPAPGAANESALEPDVVHFSMPRVLTRMPTVEFTPVEKSGPENRELESTSSLRMWHHAAILSMEGVMLLTFETCLNLASTFLPTSDLVPTYALGFIYSAFPLGGMAASASSGFFVGRWGSRGTFFSGTFLLISGMVPFGLVPVMTDKDGTRVVLFVIFGVMLGGGVGLAEPAIFPFIQQAFPNNQAAMMAYAETMLGVGSAIGPLVGGFLFNSASNFSTAWQFAFPFLVVAGIVALLVVFAKLFMQKRVVPHLPYQEPDPEATTKVSSLLCERKEIIFLLLSGTTASMCWAGLQPTLAIALEGPPYNASYSQIGLSFLVSGMAYVVVSVPLGFKMDRFPHSSFFYGLICLGSVMVIFSLWYLPPPRTELVVVTLILIGAGNTLVLLPILPALLLKFPQANDSVQSALYSLYAIATTTGELLGPPLASALLVISPPNKNICPDSQGSPDSVCFEGAMRILSLSCAASLVLTIVSSICSQRIRGKKRTSDEMYQVLLHLKLHKRFKGYETFETMPPS